MAKTILDVGQCGYDGPRMTRMLESSVGVNVDTADSIEEAIEKLAADQYDLVLVNRKLAFEGTQGVDLIREMKDAGDETPVMLVSDRPDAQREAESIGALHGFGKSQMTSPGTIKLIKDALGLSS